MNILKLKKYLKIMKYKFKNILSKYFNIIIKIGAALLVIILITTVILRIDNFDKNLKKNEYSFMTKGTSYIEDYLRMKIYGVNSNKIKIMNKELKKLKLRKDYEKSKINIIKNNEELLKEADVKYIDDNIALIKEICRKKAFENIED